MNSKVFVLVIILVVLSACKNIEPPIEKNEDNISQVEWREINPPPNEDGPCYAFFHNEAGAYVGLGYSGVWCK